MLSRETQDRGQISTQDIDVRSIRRKAMTRREEDIGP